MPYSLAHTAIKDASAATVSGSGIHGVSFEKPIISICTIAWLL